MCWSNCQTNLISVLHIILSFHEVNSIPFWDNMNLHVLPLGKRQSYFTLVQTELIKSLQIFNFVNRTYRSELLRQVIDVYKGAAMPDYVSMVQCLIILDDPNAVALVLETLSKGSQEDILMAYQVRF